MKIINMLIKVCNNVFVFLLLMFLMVIYIIVKLLGFLRLNVINKDFLEIKEMEDPFRHTVRRGQIRRVKYENSCWNSFRR